MENVPIDIHNEQLKQNQSEEHRETWFNNEIVNHSGRDEIATPTLITIPISNINNEPEEDGRTCSKNKKEQEEKPVVPQITYVDEKKLLLAISQNELKEIKALLDKYNDEDDIKHHRRDENDDAKPDDAYYDNVDIIINSENMKSLYGCKALQKSTFYTKFLDDTTKDSKEKKVYDYKDILEIVNNKILKKINSRKRISLNVFDCKKENKSKLNHPFHHLFVWAVLHEMTGMATLLLRYGNHAIAKTFIGVGICAKMNKSDNNFKYHQGHFQELLIDLWDTCKEHSWEEEIDFKKMLVWKWRNSSENMVPENQYLSFIPKSYDENYEMFVAHTVVKNIMKEIWNTSRFVIIGPPFARFYVNFIGYMLFLWLLSYIAMREKSPLDFGWLEILLVIYAVALTLQEVIQVYECYTYSNIEEYLTVWNFLDISANILFYCGFGLRMANQSDFNEYGTIVLALSTMIYIIRSLEYLVIIEKTGTYLLMIGRMFKDMMYFLIILLVFMVAYGVSVHAILKPQIRGLKMLKDIFFHPYFNIYGELFLNEELDGTNSTLFGTKIVNKYTEPVAIALLGFYLLISNALLLNLLIAILNKAYCDLDNKSKLVWQFHKLYLVVEYHDRIPVPFNVIVFFLSLLATLYDILVYFLLKCDLCVFDECCRCIECVGCIECIDWLSYLNIFMLEEYEDIAAKEENCFHKFEKKCIRMVISKGEQSERQKLKSQKSAKKKKSFWTRSTRFRSRKKRYIKPSSEN